MVDKENVPPNPSPSSKEDLRAAYEQVCKSVQAIDDFRGKLLGFLPLASGAGIFLLAGQAKDTTYLAPVGLIGFIVTLGVSVYELRGLQRCLVLIEVGRDLEEALGALEHFRDHPKPLFGFIGAGTASIVDYSAVLLAWLLLASVPAWPHLPAAVMIAAVFLVALAVTLAATALYHRRAWLLETMRARPSDELKR
jgi:hypothetical protein